MRMTQMRFPLATFFGIVLCIGCKNAIEVEPPIVPPDSTGPDSIPLDGRGGGTIAYARQPGAGPGVHEIYAINADGTGNTRITDAQIGLNHHDWSPDGERLTAVGYVSQTTSSIHVFDADGGNLTRLTSTPGVWDAKPTWSPDGMLIAFTRVYPSENERTELWVMNADGSDQQWIGVEGFAARWSPDGTHFIYASSLRGPSDIYTCDIDGTDVQQLTSTPFDESTPVWSPDGSLVAFTTDRDGNREVYVMDADGTNLRRLTSNSVAEHVPRWSPDGSLIAFTSGLPGNEHWEVYVIDTDGTNLTRLTNTPDPATAINPVWRPDPAQSGPLLIFEHGAPVTIDGDMQPSEWDDADTVRFAVEDLVDVEVRFKHDGSSLLLAFISDRKGNAGEVHPEIYVDSNNDKSLEWLADDWWFHVSATDCDVNGAYADFSNCRLTQPDWQAARNPTPPDYPPMDTTEVRIPFAKIGAVMGDRIGIAFNVHYHEGEDRLLQGLWPVYAKMVQPLSWGNAVIR